MIIKKSDASHWEIKTKLTKITLDDGVTIGEFKIPGNGEYEIKEIEAEVTDGIYIFDVEDMNIVFIDKLKKTLSPEEIKKIEDSNILFIPISGKETMDTKTALSYINTIEPEIVIPIFYDDLLTLTKSEGSKITEMEELKIAKSDINAEERKTIILK